MEGKAHIGTSGWSYEHWRGVFYPEALPQREWLEYYLKHFKSVELNNPFYRLPKKETFARWRERVPEDFIFTVKASRYITHIKKLNTPEESLLKFFEAAEGLKEKCGPILFQLPPFLKMEKEKLKRFVKALPYSYLYTFEFRHPSWFSPEVYEILRKKNIALCFGDTPNYPLEIEVTASFIYARFHGNKRLYASRYSLKELKEWAERFRGYLKEGRDVYVYFDNDYRAYAVENARELLQFLEVSGGN